MLIKIRQPFRKALRGPGAPACPHLVAMPGPADCTWASPGLCLLLPSLCIPLLSPDGLRVSRKQTLHRHFQGSRPEHQAQVRTQFSGNLFRGPRKQEKPLSVGGWGLADIPISSPQPSPDWAPSFLLCFPHLSGLLLCDNIPSAPRLVSDKSESHFPINKRVGFATTLQFKPHVFTDVPWGLQLPAENTDPASPWGACRLANPTLTLPQPRPFAHMGNCSPKALNILFGFLQSQYCYTPGHWKKLFTS